MNLFPAALVRGVVMAGFDGQVACAAAVGMQCEQSPVRACCVLRGCVVLCPFSLLACLIGLVLWCWCSMLRAQAALPLSHGRLGTADKSLSPRIIRPDMVSMLASQHREEFLACLLLVGAAGSERNLLLSSAAQP
jgi:hypothetical protein